MQNQPAPPGGRQLCLPYTTLSLQGLGVGLRVGLNPRLLLHSSPLLWVCSPPQPPFLHPLWGLSVGKEEMACEEMRGGSQVFITSGLSRQTRY